MQKNFEDNKKKPYPIPKDEAIKIIDGLFSTGWTSYYDIYIEIDRYCREQGIDYNPYNEPESLLYYTLQNRIRSEYLPFFSKIYSTVHLERPSQKVSIRELFIRRMNVSRKNGTIIDKDGAVLKIQKNGTITDKDGNIVDLRLRNSTLSFLINGPIHLPDFDIFNYIESDFSIKDDLKVYNSIAKSYNKIGDSTLERDYGQKAKKNKENEPSAISMYKEELKRSVLETHKIYGDALDPELMDIKKRSLALKNSLNNLIIEVNEKVAKKKKIIEHLKKDKPKDWIKEISNIYSNAIEMGRDIINEKDIAPFYLEYGAHLLGYWDCSKAESILNDALAIFKKPSAYEDGDISNSRGLALALELLAYLHANSNLEKYELAEKEAEEGIELFRKITQDDIRYKGDIAFLLKTLAGIHIHQNKFEQVEHEYIEAISIFSQLSNAVSGEYDRMMAECNSELGHYYASRGRDTESSIATYKLALPFWEQYYRNCEDRYNKANAIVYLVDIFHNFGDIQRCEALLLENICNYQAFNANSSNAFNFELSELYLKLGNLYTSIENFEKANEYLGKAEVVKRELACNDPILYNIDLSRTLIEQAVLLNATSDKVELSKLQEALSLLKTYNDGHITVGLCYYWMGFFCYIHNNYDDALPYLDNAERIYRQLSNKEIGSKLTDGILAIILKLYGDIFSDQTFNGYNPEIAEQKYKDALDIENQLNKTYGKVNDGLLTEIYVFYGCLLCNEGRFLEAEPLLECGLKLYEQNAISTIDINLLREVLKEVKKGLGSPVLNQNSSSGNVESPNPLADSESFINSVQDEINSLKISNGESKEKCYRLYQKIITHCAIMGQTTLLADVLSSYCTLLANDCHFQKMAGYALQALNIYSEALNNNDDYALWSKYIEILIQYCRGLSLCGSQYELKQIIDKAVNIIPAHPKSQKNKAENLFVVLKNKFYLDYVLESPSNDAQKISEQMVSCYRASGNDNPVHFVNILLTAATTAGENGKWSKMHGCLTEAKKIVQLWDLNNPEERVAAGRLYALIGVYHQIVPGEFSQEKILKAYEKARIIYEEGISLYPDLFKSKLLNLYYMVIDLPFAFNSSGINDTIHTMYKLMEELSESNPFIFNHQCVNIQLEIESLYQSEYLSCFDVGVDNELLSQRYNHSMSSYDAMESLLLIYGKSAPELYSKYMEKIDEARKKLTSIYLTTIGDN